ncbi:MAG: hypothetical protein IPP07_08955 [Holophagales bacterium]|nr:hypothetical protein [Holophagales bacterium]
MRNAARTSLALSLLRCSSRAATSASRPGGPPHREGNRLDMGDQPKLKPQRGTSSARAPRA